MLEGLHVVVCGNKACSWSAMNASLGVLEGYFKALVGGINTNATNKRHKRRVRKNAITVMQRHGVCCAHQTAMTLQVEKLAAACDDRARKVIRTTRTLPPEVLRAAALVMA